MSEQTYIDYKRAFRVLANERNQAKFKFNQENWEKMTDLCYLAIDALNVKDQEIATLKTAAKVMQAETEMGNEGEK